MRTSAAIVCRPQTKRCVNFSIAVKRSLAVDFHYRDNRQELQPLMLTFLTGRRNVLTACQLMKCLDKIFMSVQASSSA